MLPKSIHLFIGFSIIFTIHFGVPLFLETPILAYRSVIPQVTVVFLHLQNQKIPNSESPGQQIPRRLVKALFRGRGDGERFEFQTVEKTP